MVTIIKKGFGFNCHLILCGYLVLGHQVKDIIYLVILYIGSVNFHLSCM